MTEAIQTIENIVAIKDGLVVTDSLKIAEVFVKRHKDVLKAIRDLNIPDDYRRRNFAPTVITRPNPAGGKDIPSNAYILSRDGFTILAMGFISKNAMQFKLAYIEAFNRMETKLAERFGLASQSPSQSPFGSKTTAILQLQGPVEQYAMRDTERKIEKIRTKAKNWGITDVSEFQHLVALAFASQTPIGFPPVLYESGAIHPATIARALAKLSGRG